MVTGHVGVKYSNIRDIVVSCSVFLNPLKERQCLPVDRRAFSLLWLQWLSGGIVRPLVTCFDVELFLVLCGGEMPLICADLGMIYYEYCYI